jgi:hypothetical protein
MLTAERIAAKSQYAGHMYYQFELEESWDRAGVRAFGRINGGLVFEAAHILDPTSVPLLSVFYADKSHNNGMSHHPVFRKCLCCIYSIYVFIQHILHILHILIYLSTSAWLAQCQSTIIYQRREQAQVLYVIPVSSILGRLPLVPVGATGTIPFAMRRETADFPGAFKFCDKSANGGDGCRWWYVNSWARALGWGTKQ